MCKTDNLKKISQIVRIFTSEMICDSVEVIECFVEQKIKKKKRRMFRTKGGKLGLPKLVYKNGILYTSIPLLVYQYTTFGIPLFLVYHFGYTSILLWYTTFFGIAFYLVHDIPLGNFTCDNTLTSLNFILL